MNMNNNDDDDDDIGSDSNIDDDSDGNTSSDNDEDLVSLNVQEEIYKRKKRGERLRHDCGHLSDVIHIFFYICLEFFINWYKTKKKIIKVILIFLHLVEQNCFFFIKLSEEMSIRFLDA